MRRVSDKSSLTRFHLRRLEGCCRVTDKLRVAAYLSAANALKLHGLEQDFGSHDSCSICTFARAGFSTPPLGLGESKIQVGFARGLRLLQPPAPSFQSGTGTRRTMTNGEIVNYDEARPPAHQLQRVQMHVHEGFTVLGNGRLEKTVPKGAALFPARADRRCLGRD